jgi:hypothetical protein
MGLRRFANESWRKILSPAPSLYLESAALGRTAAQGNPVIIGEAMMSSPFRNLRVCPPQMGIERSFKGIQARGEGKPVQTLLQKIF